MIRLLTLNLLVGFLQLGIDFRLIIFHLKYDEYQDLDPSFEPIINHTLSAGYEKSLAINPEKASQAGIMRFGTPLTFENGLEQAWSLSSQAEWCIVCRNCRYPPYIRRTANHCELLKQLTSEVPRFKEGTFSKNLWQLRPGSQNHLLDCLVYAFSGALIEQGKTLDGGRIRQGHKVNIRFGGTQK